MKCLLIPKNKFVRLAINVIFILFWSWFFLSYFYSYWLFIAHTPIYNLLSCGTISWDTFYCADGSQAYGYGVISHIIDWIALILPSLLVTKFIWFPKRPKITRSKD